MLLQFLLGMRLPKGKTIKELLLVHLPGHSPEYWKKFKVGCKLIQTIKVTGPDIFSKIMQTRLEIIFQQLCISFMGNSNRTVLHQSS